MKNNLYFNNKSVEKFYLLEGSYQGLLPNLEILLEKERVSIFNWLCYQLMDSSYIQMKRYFDAIKQEYPTKSSFLSTGCRLVSSCYIAEFLRDKVSKNLLELSLKEFTEPKLVKLLDENELLFIEAQQEMFKYITILTSETLISVADKLHTNMLSYIANQKMEYESVE